MKMEPRPPRAPQWLLSKKILIDIIRSLIRPYKALTNTLQRYGLQLTASAWRYSEVMDMIISVAPPFCQKMQPQSCGILKLGSAVHVVIVNCVETCQARSLRWVTCVLATNRLDSTCVATMMSSSSRLRRWTIRLIFSSCFCSQVSQ